MVYTLFDELHWLVEQGIDNIISTVEESGVDVFMKEDIEAQAKELEEYKNKVSAFVKRLKTQ